MSKTSHEKDNYQWNSTFSFLMAMIGAAVGLGNIWRFSYVLYSNGGGAFFIPYVVAILIMGIPFLILEYGLGATFKNSLSNILKKIRPQLEVIGWITAFLVFLVLTYYVVIMGWDMIYLVLSLFKGWGTNPDAYFMTNIVVGSNNLQGITSFVIPTLIATILIWVLLWYISHKALDKGISKVVNILIPLLFIMMAIIVIYAFTLPGMWTGVTALLNPDWSLLLYINVWLAAFGQIIFSLSMGQAIAVTYASYLPEKSKLVDNVLVVVLSNSSFEIFTAFGVFSILGFMSLTSGLPIHDIATSGTGLLFVVFPEIFNVMGDMAYIIAPIFFLCVFFAGITSALAFLEPMTLAVSRKFRLPRVRSVTILCIFGALMSLVYTTASGNYILTIADGFINQFGIILVVILQSLIFGWSYGVEKLLPVLNEYSTVKVGKTWVFVIKYLLPIFLSVMWIIGMIDLFKTQSSLDIILQLIIALIFVVIPLVLTILPSREDI
ncbi:sodium-dependent transporter [Methanosphaera sp. ISO3-F5]|uniref:sodium-dependent transporter n=1 Tax=Methanosphaera sp. ISO3-F5 TaxID=1452353 RepID=UPI002B260A29|nr:sodium-dependent transporter [Methanosphaera sp. ISO3-F5]WQH64125.1 sodium-dependent transporter [Methanosphaera sp. ISO3-F5]